MNKKHNDVNCAKLMDRIPRRRRGEAVTEPEVEVFALPLVDDVDVDVVVGSCPVVDGISALLACFFFLLAMVSKRRMIIRYVLQARKENTVLGLD